MLQAQMVLDQVISLVTTHWQQDVSEVYVCTSFVQAHRQYFLAEAIDRPPVVTNGAIVIHTQRLKSDPGGNLLS